jgi:Arc/MetJ-type ribon-helix-helix transcriptional regulator
MHGMKTYVHARLSEEERAALEVLKKATGHSESELLRRGLRLVRQELEKQGTALQVAGASAGKFRGGPKDLARNKRHLADFGR